MQFGCEILPPSDWSIRVWTELRTLKIPSSCKQWELEQKRPVSFLQGDGSWEFAGISQACLSRFPGEETHRVCTIYGGQKVKGQNPTLNQNNNKTHQARDFQGHPFCVGEDFSFCVGEDFSYRTSRQTELWKFVKVEGRLGGKFLLRNYLKRILSASEQQDTRGVVWGGERRDCLYWSGFCVSVAFRPVFYHLYSTFQLSLFVLVNIPKSWKILYLFHK